MSDQADLDVDARAGDRRVQRTRAALQSAFNRLILTRGYDGFSAVDVAEEADVGRSTFYEHYRGKEDILAETLAPVLTPLAGCCLALTPRARLAAIVQHFWDNRKMVRALMSGRSQDVVIRQLARLIEERLTSNALQIPKAAGALPPSLAAVQIAAGQLALIGAWLSGRHGCTADQIAQALNASGRSALAPTPAP